MIIVLKGADFSANNIGQVRVNTELNSYTKKAIEASGNTNLTMQQQFALDDLFIAMGVDGSNDVMSKIRRLYLPIIAGDVSKALVNYNTSSFVIDQEITSECWTLRNHGLVGTKSGQEIVLTENNPIQTKNFSSFFLRTETMVSGVDDSSYSIILRGQKDDSAFLGLRQQSVSSHESVTMGEYGRTWGAVWRKGTDIIKASGLISNGDTVHRNMRGVWDTKTITATNADMSGETKQTVYAFGFNTVQTTKPYAVAMIGEAIDPEIAKNICEKIDALYQTFVS